MVEERFSFPRSELRSRAARGAIVNGAFLLAVELLGVIQAVLVARLLGTAEVGMYGIVSVTVMTLLSLKQIGIDEAFVQQDQSDQEMAFRQAFSLDLALSAAFTLVTAALAPLIGSIYADQSLTPLMLALSLLPLLFALQAPAWIFLRRMDFVRQRSLQAIVPAVTLVTTIGLILAGFQAWALVLGALSGNIAAAILAASVSPYSMRPVIHIESARRYMTFSAPIFLAAICGLIIRQGQTLAFESTLGLAGAGYLTLAVTLTRYADRADQLITQTIYPAICAISDSPKRLAEVFEKSNRITAMWALPFGAGLALFTPDLVDHVLGRKWEPAIPLVQLVGVSTAIYQLGFNWTAFHRAVGRTRPQTVYAIAGLVAFLAAPLPLLLEFGALGFGWGLFAVNIVAGALRWTYMKQLLPNVRILHVVARSFIPPLAATAAILGWRLAGGSETNGIALWIGQMFVFVVLYASITAVMERELLTEAVGYLRRHRSETAAPSDRSQ
jgi:O-antigen/teichoic acid export membrane protein